MGATTGIAWTDHTASPWWGCQRVSPGCEHCYAETLAVTRRKLPVWGPPSTAERKRIASFLSNVSKWNARAHRDGVRRRLFVASMCDVFEDHPQVTEWRQLALYTLQECHDLDVQLLTKRPENIRAMVPPEWLRHWPDNVWVGTTVEDQRRAEERIPHLLNVPARVRFLSCEPLLEAVDLKAWLRPSARTWGRNSSGSWGCDSCCNGDRCDDSSHRDRRFCKVCKGTGIVPYDGIAWVIVGGESGPRARPFDLAWARSIVGQCRDAGVPAFVKQMGDHAMLDGQRQRYYARHGADPNEWPVDLRVQQFPEAVH